MRIEVHTQDRVTTVRINRPKARNAVDGPTAQALYEAFVAFDADAQADVAVLAGAGGTFCAGADLKALAEGFGADSRANPLHPDMQAIAPMGPTRLQLAKPVIAAIDGYAVAGGLELALWCDLRVMDEGAQLGVFCRRWGVPLIDGGTVRLPRLIGQSRAMDLILTGRAVGAQEALAMGLANRVAPAGQALTRAQQLAREMAAFPQTCLRSDHASLLAQWSLEERAALAQEFANGMATIESGATVQGAARFAQGAGRHGALNQGPTGAG
jgi:enoyl-CoA hydratase